jgi:hypothetical protein
MHHWRVSRVPSEAQTGELPFEHDNALDWLRRKQGTRTSEQVILIHLGVLLQVDEKQMVKKDRCF